MKKEKREIIKEINIHNSKECKNMIGNHLKIEGRNSRAIVAEVKNFNAESSSVVICECTEIDLM